MERTEKTEPEKLLERSPGLAWWAGRGDGFSESSLFPDPIYSRDRLGNKWERTMHGMVNRGVY